jgi:predicted DNA-binding transcriptional regulator AlpA
MISENEERAQGRVLYTRVDLRLLGIRISNSTLLRLEAAGKWPKRVRIADHSVAWLRDEVDAHIAKLADQRGQR